MKSYSPPGRRKGDGSFELGTLSPHRDDEGDLADYLGRKREKPCERIPSYGLVPLLGFLLLLGYLTSLIDESMPRPVGEVEAGFKAFSEERAWRHLRAIVGDGPRVAGGNQHLLHTEQLKAALDELAAAADRMVRTDWQQASGDYYLTYSMPFVNSYERASNVIALLEGESGFNADGTTNSSVLFNCHYDSVPTSPGASDNAIFCAVMFETLLVLSRGGHKFKHNIVFLFNGAEENVLQASHGFLSHPWCKGVTALVNLDSAGMNGRSVLFQVSDPRVLAAYAASVPGPSAQASGEALFLSGLVPSDTDFRIFRDFAQIYGVDIAFTRNGHVYHTRFDSLQLVRPGVVQHAGELVFNLARRMADMDEFSEKLTEPSTAVYWDYLYLFMANYSLARSNLDAAVAALALSALCYLWTVGMRWKLVKELLLAVLSTLASLLSGCLLVSLLTLLLVATAPQLRYYSQPWLVVPMFWSPFLLAALSTSHAIDTRRSSKSCLRRAQRVAQAMAAARLAWSALLLALVFVPISATMRYAISVPLLLTHLAAFVSLAVQKFYRLKAWQHLSMELVLALPALLFIFSICLKLDAMMLPIMGRSATARPDYTAAAINLLLVALCTMPLAGVELLFSRRRLWLVLSALGALSLALAYLPLAVYSAEPGRPAPQRYNVYHTQRVSYNQSGDVVARSSGLWIGHTDANSPATLLSAVNLTAVSVQRDFTADCEEYLFCNLPTILPRSLQTVPFSAWIDFPAPDAFDPAPALELISRSCSGDRCELNFTMSGTPHVSLALWPRDGVTLERWSFSAPVTNVSSKRGRPVYYVYHTRCTHGVYLPLHVSLVLQMADGVDGSSDPLLDVKFDSHKTHHPEELTAEFSDFVHSLPEWFNVVPYITTSINYVF